MKLRILAAQPVILRSHVDSPELDLSAVHQDSRAITPGTAFYALRGTRVDGHDYLEAALQAGAPALFVSDPTRFDHLTATPPPSLGGVFLVPPGREALAEVARLIYGDPSRYLKLLGVTGTNGKATVTFLAAQMLEALGKPCGIIGSLGMRLGAAVEDPGRTTPEAPDVLHFLRRCVEQGIPCAAMEVSSIGLHQGRIHGLTFAAAAFTNLTQDHLDYHADMEDYAAQKARLFLEYAPPWAVMNLDDAFGRRLEALLRRERPRTGVLTYSLDGAAALMVTGVEQRAEGSRGLLRVRGESFPFTLPLPGAFNLANWLAAVGLLLACGYAPRDVAEAARHCRGAPGRFQRLALPHPFVVVVDYAHTPDALETVLRTARRLTQGRVAVLFGCGGERDRAKRPLMGAIAQRLADFLVLTSDNPRGEDPQAILREIESGMSGATSHLCIPDRRAAIHALLEQARPGDFLVLAGKGAETYQEVAGDRRPFDDREVVREWAQAHPPS
jgi:UDP-N-acetylmuramoyl-L-alanyl-D-glutamate--2,6-diaminopimelate ligase